MGILTKVSFSSGLEIGAAAALLDCAAEEKLVEK